MTNQLLAVYAEESRLRQEVCFIVVAENINRMGRPLMAKFGKVLWENYRPLRVLELGPAPDRDVGFVEAFGPKASLPKN